DFACTRCPYPRVMDALARRGLMPESHLYTAAGALEAGLQPLDSLIQQPPDWLWPNRIPLGKLTLIAGYPSSGKTSIALDIAARVSRGGAAPDQPDADFPSAPVILALLDGNPKADVLPTLRLFGADLGRIYLADLLSPTIPIDYYPDDPPQDDGPDYKDEEEEGDDDADDEEGNARRQRSNVGIKLPDRYFMSEEPRPAATDFTTPWPSLSRVMKRLANLIEAGRAALLVVDQVEDLASMHRAQVATVLGMLKALAARSGAAVIALTHNPAPNYPRAVSAMQRRLAQASVVFTTAAVGPAGKRFLVPLRPAMSEEAPAIPFALPPSPVAPAGAGAPQPFPWSSHDFTVAWRKPVFSVFQSTERGAVLVGSRFGSSRGGIDTNVVWELQLHHFTKGLADDAKAKQGSSRAEPFVFTPHSDSILGSTPSSMPIHVVLIESSDEVIGARCQFS
ncbi:MAG: AAA family ATPase, partial [Chloroflexi bacterium]|nr:AAA family ATPase [Chloroflexota bacterium]